MTRYIISYKQEYFDYTERGESVQEALSLKTLSYNAWL